VSGVVLLAVLCAGAADAASRGAEIDAVMRPYTGEVPGASLVVLRDNQVLIRRAYGFADLRHRVVATPASNYRLASVTKQFTAAAILLLAQDRRLSLDDPVRRYLPSLPAADDAVTLRQLLSHRGGMIDYEELIPAGTVRQLHDTDVLRLLEREDRTYFAPGSDYRYSDTGYALLSLVVAGVSGKDFASFLHDRIFAPLGMSATVAYQAGLSRVADRAYGYSLEHGQWLETDQSLTSAVLGDGGVYSSVDDLVRWDAALAGPGLLNAESLRQAFTAVTPTDDPNVRYALGWRITGDTVWHSGESLGFRNVIVRWPQRHFTVILLTNRNDGDPYACALAIARLFVPDADRVRASAVVVGPDSGAHRLPQ
jgi:CubicO group peptidase (beta-lactamase class C family)